MLDALMFSLSITMPICLMLFLGMFLRRVKLFDDTFIAIGSKLVFQVTLPALLFLNILDSPSLDMTQLPLITVGLLGNLLFFFFAHFSLKPLGYPHADHSVILQGGYRSNTGIVALAYVANAYGSDGIALAAIYVGVCTILYNILAVIALTPPDSNQNKSESIKSLLVSMLKNPLIISIAFAFAYKATGIPLPSMLEQTGHYLADMTLPLALLCTGGSIDLKSFRKSSKGPWISTIYKLILNPIFIVAIGYFAGLRDIYLGLLFFMTATPTAAASYVMARAMGANATMAANIIALTTIASLITCTLGIAFLKGFGLM